MEKKKKMYEDKKQPTPISAMHSSDKQLQEHSSYLNLNTKFISIMGGQNIFI